MGLCTVDKFFCLIDLRWGVLIIGILDIILGIVGYVLSARVGGQLLNILIIICYFVHFVGCIFLIVSVFVQKYQLVICYLITGLIRIILLIILIIIQAAFEYDYVAMYIIEGLILALGIYFWICVYSWFVKLGGKSC